MSEDLYFYKGKYRTEEGLKRELIKDKTIWVSPKRNYYCFNTRDEYFWPYEEFKERAEDYDWCSKEELKHFRKWINEKLETGELDILNTQFYHSDYTDGIGMIDFWDCLEEIREGMDRFDPKYPDDFIETLEQTVEEYVETISDEEFKKFEKLPEKKQDRIAMNWRIKMYKEALHV